MNERKNNDIDNKEDFILDGLGRHVELYDLSNENMLFYNVYQLGFTSILRDFFIFFNT